MFSPIYFINYIILMSRKQKNKQAYKAKRAEAMARKRKAKVLFQSEGKVQMTREGFCYVITGDPQIGDVYVKAVKAHGALNGDQVSVDVTKRKPGEAGKPDRYEGVITKIIQRSPRPFVGFLHIVGKQAWVIMQSKVMPYDIQILEIPEGAKQGYKVAAVVDDWPRGEYNPIGHIVDVLGEPGANDTEMHAILAEFGLPYRFEPEIEKAADKISEEISAEEIKKRKDFRKVLTFTIDPADAKDFDDAISYKKLPGGKVQVGVHIADVTHYVTENSPVDKEARERGTSVYLADRTVPMLPEKLCNKLCSLRPDEDKLCFSAVFELDAEANVVGKWFGRTVIRSAHRFDYEQAQAIIEKQEPETEIEKTIHILWGLAAKLRQRRFETGAVSFERPEMKIICDEKGRPVEVLQKISKEANWLIEEYMLLANRSVAEFVAKECGAKTFVYRVHDLPVEEKLQTLGLFVKNFGYKFRADKGSKKIASELNALFAKVKDKPEAEAIAMMGLRCMAKAKYDVENIGHYGLGFEYYTHFTSPIRRYPDMMVHRLLAQYLADGKNADKQYYEGLCQHSSDRETVATNAERASIKYKMVEYMQDKVGYTFDGMVSGITEWGMYVQVEPTHIEGMVALRDIKSDYFYFDEEHYVIRGRKTKTKYTLGTPVKIKVTRADLDQKVLDFELIEK